MSRREMKSKPVGGEIGDLVQRPVLAEQMPCPRHDLEVHHSGLHLRQCLAIQLEHVGIGSADDEECWGSHHREGASGEVRPTAARDDGANSAFALRRSDEGGRGARAGSEEANPVGRRTLILRSELDCGGEPRRQQRDVETMVPGHALFGFFRARQQIHEQRAETTFPQRCGDGLIPGAVAAAAASVSEDHQAGRRRGDDQLAFQRCGACGNRHEGCSHVSSVANRQWAG